MFDIKTDMKQTNHIPAPVVTANILIAHTAVQVFTHTYNNIVHTHTQKKVLTIAYLFPELPNSPLSESIISKFYCYLFVRM